MELLEGTTYIPGDCRIFEGSMINRFRIDAHEWDDQHAHSVVKVL